MRSIYIFTLAASWIVYMKMLGNSLIDNFVTNEYCLYYYNISEYCSLVYHTIPFNYLLFMSCVHSLFASDAIMVAVLATGMEKDIRQFFFWQVRWF